MKYLKTFESTIEEQKILKYIIIKWAPTQLHKNLFLLEVFHTNKDVIKIIQLYTYDILTGKITKDYTQYSKQESLELKNWKILYSSNSLEECLEKIKILTDTNKYNL